MDAEKKMRIIQRKRARLENLKTSTRNKSQDQDDQ
jgi:hypothetical protein